MGLVGSIGGSVPAGHGLGEVVGLQANAALDLDGFTTGVVRAIDDRRLRVGHKPWIASKVVRLAPDVRPRCLQVHDVGLGAGIANGAGTAIAAIRVLGVPEAFIPSSAAFAHLEFVTGLGQCCDGCKDGSSDQELLHHGPQMEP